MRTKETGGQLGYIGDESKREEKTCDGGPVQAFCGFSGRQGLRAARRSSWVASCLRSFLTGIKMKNVTHGRNVQKDEAHTGKKKRK